MSDRGAKTGRSLGSLDLVTVFGPALLILAVTLFGYFHGGYIQYIVFLSLIAIICAVALVLVIGLARMITLASGAMMGLGAYTIALLLDRFDPMLPIGMVAAALVGGFAGMVLGVLTIRFRGHYLAMVTLVFQSVIIIVIRQWPELTGGTQGMWVPRGSIFGMTLETDTQLLILGAVTAILAVAALAILIKGHFGRVLRAIAATEVGAEAFGINIPAFRIMAFSVSSAVIALAGSVHALQVRILDPEAYGLLTSVLMLAYPIVGGMTSVWGGVIGGGLLQSLPEMLRFVSEYKEFVYATLVIVVMIFLPGGLVEIFERATAWTRRARPDAPSAPARAATRAGPAPVPAANATAAVPRDDAGLPALEVVGLSKSFGALAAVSNVGLSVPSGAIHGIIGPNGAGKTTLFNLISGFLAPDAGTISIYGTPMNEKSARQRIVCGATRTFQNVAVFGKLSCVDNVVIGLGTNGVAASMWKSVEDIARSEASQERRVAAIDALAAVGLEGYADVPAGTLSLGDQRCLEIARAIVSRPRILLLDEPVSGLEADERARLHDLLVDINASHGVTMLVIEHNIQFVLDLCRNLTIMHAGALLAEGVPGEVIERPEVRRVYFGESDEAS